MSKDRKSSTATKSSSSKKVARRIITPNMINIMAVILFACGIYVAVNSWATNRNIRNHIQSTEQSSDGSETFGGYADEEKPKDNLEDYRVAPDMPRLITIPSIGVRARIIRMGVTKDNAVDVPKNIFDVGWYDGSAKPGTNGAAFLDGHVSGPTQHGVFYDIKKLQPGDKLTVEKGNGEVLSYTVVKNVKYSKDNVDMTAALSPVTSGKNGLNLITCAGKFNAEDQSFQDRIVVFTEQD